MIEIRQEKNRRILSFMKDKRELIYTFKTSWNLSDDQFLQKFQNTLCCFSCMLCSGASYVEALISIYREVGLI